MREDIAFKNPGSVLANEKLDNPSMLRAKLCLVLLIIGFTAIGVKLVKIQVLDHGFWVRYVDDQRQTAITIYPRRGTIYDRNRTPLATSVVEETLCLAKPRVADLVQAAGVLSLYAQMSPQQIVEKIEKSKLYLVYLRRGLDVETAKKIDAMKIKGVEFRSESSRHYPKGVLASNLMGFANMENKGLEGVEYRYDTELAGESGKQIVIKDSSRREIVPLTQMVKYAQDGSHVVLTIDEVIQYITEKALDGVVQEFSPESAAAVVLNPKTGEVLAMVCRPTFDPNKPSASRSERLRNRVVTDVFEPGSTFKPIAAAAALERRVITPEDRVYCELGRMRFHGHTFDDVHPQGEISFADVIAQSSNIGMIKVVSMLQPDTLYGYIKGFGFGDLTGIDLPGESAGIFRPPSKWSGLSMGSLSIGQEIGVTTLQLASAFSAIANKGVLMKPYVVSAILSPDGETISERRPEAVRQVMKPKTAEALTRMLERVVTSGTGTLAKVNGYKCAGKTGTAQKSNVATGGYLRGKYVAVFGGYVPSDDPVACIVVVVDSPQGKYYGGLVAAPAFREIAQGIVNYNEIPPSMPEEQVQPEIVNPPVLLARRSPQKAGTGDAAASRSREDDGLPHMPDVKGMTMKAILGSLAIYSLKLEFEGSGVAFNQNPAPGEKIVNGQRCQIAFRRKDTP